MDKAVLKPCPFCGGEAVLMTINDEIGECVIDSEEELNNSSLSSWIHCYNCSSNWFFGESEIPKDTVEAWNRRAKE
ncbi:hypothetical protein DW929_07315 [Eubacterium ventriosum]|jgi:hypothetical protein|uniref:Restriction alleviation protein, Lar family n=1 Tax=Eubacterium ventriosum TaxID=39496 RepID=A0A413RZX9_9FIRM|nr:Lar family restriction alleviation protein [Eubacterium ventriosum]RHA54483.1 hypothetical protein DW929_07315 [Eubacterium ventriosum]